MDKRIRIELNNYAKVPLSLRAGEDEHVPKTEVVVDLAKLFHHYYLDTYGQVPPQPDPAHFEHVRFLVPESEFRMQGSGLGVSTSARRNRSTELGQAFCRWFLHDHLNITYFAHVGDLIGRQHQRGIGGCAVRRLVDGDTPDYLCAESSDNVFLAEAKGRYSSISFKRKDFSCWRDQFDRVQVVDASGVPRVVKGHIVATRFATEEDSASIRTTLFAEDPASRGEGPLEGEPARSLAAAVIGAHYGRIAEKLDQPLLAAALLNGIALPREILVQVVLWKLSIDPMKSRLFVGGYYPGPSGEPAFELREGAVQSRRRDPLRLDQPRGTFVGVEENIFRQIVSACRESGQLARQPGRLEYADRIYSAISMLRDGSVMGPVEFFEPVRAETL
jgi:hypothetical protein